MTDTNQLIERLNNYMGEFGDAPDACVSEAADALVDQQKRIEELEAALHDLVFASKDMVTGITVHNARHEPKIEGAVPTLFYRAIQRADTARAALAGKGGADG